METLTLASLVILAVGLGAGSAQNSIKRTERRIARVERKLDLILDHLGLSETEPELAQVTEHLRNGKKIHAIKAYREITGADLKEAKEAVDRMA
ncbi:ribosomal protein L7/L12 [Streptomyces olivoverticillatus]|uniref:Ribosomal protein L7/L12 n=1 Tax=Streptomyces olivoverticillatus TaxID=66427 RepID=A0A7W7LM09_9ACTN|nr:ribosomal protein L7/L12 [Streptomyces olivoverticillatus]MBB4892153.1 ribosomal protein L7/L12 [Streptomyces olivoverticillatus]